MILKAKHLSDKNNLYCTNSYCNEDVILPSNCICFGLFFLSRPIIFDEYMIDIGDELLHQGTALAMLFSIVNT